MRICFTAFLILGLATPALAEDFTFTAVGRDGVSANVTLDGRNIGAVSSTVTSTAIGSDGKAQTSNGICQSWTPEPAADYSIVTVCNYTTGQGRYATISWCPKDSTADCSGKLVGVGGAYLNRMGTFSVRTKPGPTAETDSYTGSGHWN